MAVSSIQIRRLRTEDFSTVQEMETGIENDYVVHIFPQSVNREATFGLFVDGKLAVIAAYTIFGGHYAVLGRLRTDLRYRGRGFATRLLSELCRIVDAAEQIHWVGLATELKNTPVHHIAKKLSMDRLSVYYSCVTGHQNVKHLAGSGSGDSREWALVDSNQEKRVLLNTVTPENNPLGIFPYECYYSLPYEETLWHDAYLSRCVFQKKHADFVVLMPDEKGAAYLHVKYFGKNIFSESGLWRSILTEAEKTGREIWIDLPYPDGLPAEKAGFFRTTSWVCYGRRSPQIG